MKSLLGEYELKCSFDPKVIDNSSSKKILINDIGFIYNCVFKQEKAFVNSVNEIRKYYPQSKMFIVSDGGFDYSYLENDLTKFLMQEDTVSCYKNITSSNFLTLDNQYNLKRGISATIKRLTKGIEYCGYPKWFCMTEPDVLFRGKIHYPENAKLIGSRVNYAWDSEERIKSFININKLLEKIPGAIPLVRWGSVPVIGETKTLMKAIDVYKNNIDILDKLTEAYYDVQCFDLFLPILYALVGEQEVFSDEYTECLRNPDWKRSSATIVHQYREHYQENDFYWGKSSMKNRVKSLKVLIKKLLIN